ncbi:uncharacterized protein LOC113796521 [Dermatophagoides pteronyssinus]|uniref:uncharacterized protein LOC113796521 n=1 Tax=Dermatophagoides pteronyssinus TaxID=6956 RepID=UPI003F67FAB8
MDDGGRCLLDVINDPQLLQSFLENNSNNNNTTQQQTNSNSNSSSTSNVVVSSASAAVASNTTIINAPTIVQPPPPPPLSLSTISSTPSIIINQNKNDSVFNTAATTIDQLSMPSSSMVATTTTQPIIVPNNNNNGIINPIITIPKTLASQIQIVGNNNNNNNQLMATTISTTPTTTTTNKPVRARKSTAVATKSNSSSKSIKNQQMTNLSSSTTIPTSISSISGILGSSNIATSIASNTLVAATPTFLNSTTGLIPITSLATTGGAGGGGLQGLIFAGSHLTHSNATSNVQSIRHPSTFVSTPQFQLGPRPMTVLPQPFILPGGLQLATNGSNNQQQFVFARPSLSHQQHQTTGPQLLQIIQTSQGPQLIAQAPSAPIQTIATSNHIQTINVQQQQQQTSTVLTPTTSAAIITKNSKGSNKQILPKPNSAKNSKTNHQQNQIQNQNNNSQNIKFIQTPTVGGTTNPFSTSTNQNATQFIIGGGGGVSGGIHQNHQPQLIAGPNGTFFLSNNNLLHTNTGQTQFSQQPQFLLQNQQLLAIRPSSGTGSLAGQTFLVNPNALTTAANNNLNNNNDQLTALNQLTIPQSSSIINTNKSSTTTSSTNITHHHATSLNHILLNQNTTPIVSQASQGLTAFRQQQQQQQQAPGNLIIRPQIIGQQSLPPTSLSSSTTTTVNNNCTPQLIQIQTPNGPILLSVNLNSSQQQQQQQPSQPQIQQSQTPQPQPQTIQIDNTLYSLTTNPVNQQPTLNLGGGGAATLSQAILTNQTHNQQQQQLLTHHHQNFSSNQQLHQQQTILSSSNNNQKNQTTTTTITKPKTQNPTKGLNLADLLKETGILTEFSPPTSPISITQTKDNNNSANVLIDPLTRISTPSSQSQTILMVSNSNNNLSTTATTTNAVAAAANTALAPSSLQSQTQQLRISLTPDGTIVLLSPNSNTLLPTIQQQQQGINNLTATTIIGQTKNTNNSKQQQQQQTVVNDSSGLGSSQPSPDSTTPSIDTGSCSSPSTVITTQTTQSLPTQTIKNINSIDSKSLDNNTVDDTVVSSLSSTNQSSLKTLTSSTATTTTTTCTADTSSINQSIKPSHLMNNNNNTSLVLSQQQPTLPLMTNNQTTTTTTTYTTILIPGTIMFLNDKRIPIATLNRTNQIGELMQRLDNQIKQNILQQQQQQPKDLQQELQQLQQTLLLIQSQPIIPSQIPQVKISDKIAQLLQISTWATQSTQIKTSPQTIAVVNHNQSSIGTTITTTTTTTTTTSITTPTTVKFVLGPKINSNSIQLVHSISNSSPINPLSSSSSSPSTTAKQTTTLTATDSIQSPDLKTQITTSPVITTPIIVKQEKPKSNILKAIQSQLHADQNTALHPDCRTPFRSRDDACKRLLRYHVFDQQQFSEKQLQKFDELFEQASQTLLYKRQQLYDKFRYLIIKDSMKYSPSCEQVMVNRIIIDEENAALKSDKELVASGGVLDLPPLPETWLEDSQQLQQQDSHKNDEENIRQKHLLFDTDELMNVDYFDNITLKRKFEEDNSAADFLLESTTTTTTNLFTTTSSELNSDLNALCDIFDEESIANPTSINNDDNDDVDKLIKLHSPIDTNNDSDFLGIDGLNDHNNDDDDDDNDSLLRCNNQNFDDSSRAITDVDDDLEALYSNITDTSDLIGNNQNSLLWPNDSNHNHHMLNSTTDSLSHNNHHHRNQDHFLGRSISTGGGGQSSLSWSTRSYGNVNETEAAVAVQSIIGGNDDNDIPTDDHDNDGTMDFSSLELSDNVHGDNTTATSNNHFGNEDLFPNDHQSFDDNVRESSTAIDTTNFIQNSMTNNNNNTSAADMQMNCAIKSIMMPSDSYHINNDNMSSSSTSSLNNELSYQHQNHHQQQTSMMLPTSTISTSTNMMNRFSSSNNSMMMMNSFSVPSTMSHVNDPMLDEAVKSIL